MTIVFNDDDLISAYKQQRNILRGFLGVTLFFVVICVACLVYFMSLPYEDPLQPVPQVIVSVVSCVYVVFAYVFMGIKFHRARRYYKLISYVSVGMKQVNNSIFLRYEEPELRDGVDFYVLIFSEWSKKKSEYMDRKIYCDKEKPLPKFQKGDEVCYLTQGNVIIEYEIVGHDENFAAEKEKEDANRKPLRIGEVK